MVFCHAHLCMNDYPYTYGFSVFIMHTFLQMTIHIFVSVFVMYIFLRMTILMLFVLIFVMHIFLQMTIHAFMGFRNSHLCTNDYPYSYGFFVMAIFLWMSILFPIFYNASLLNWNSEFLGVFSSNFSVSPCTKCSPTHEKHSAVNAL